eukprot:jgi/Chlat1/2791/Chrsp187S08762
MQVRSIHPTFVQESTCGTAGLTPLPPTPTGNPAESTNTGMPTLKASSAAADTKYNHSTASYIHGIQPLIAVGASGIGGAGDSGGVGGGVVGFMVGGFFRRVRNFFGGGEEEQATAYQASATASGFRRSYEPTRDSSRPFAVKREVAVERQLAPLAPVVQAAGYSPGGIQGLSWYLKSLHEDDDGDVATSFWSEKGGSLPARLWAAVARGAVILLLDGGNVYPMADLDPAEAQQWTEQDEQCARQNSWRQCRSRKDAVVYDLRNDGSALRWLKVEAPIDCSLSDIDSLLDADLVSRQKQWHKLFVEGRSLSGSSDLGLECLYMAYASPVGALVSTRDTVYWKVRRNLPGGGFILSYRTTENPSAPVARPRVRIWFQGAHIITPRPEGGVGVLLDEVAGVKVATAGSSSSAVKSV